MRVLYSYGTDMQENHSKKLFDFPGDIISHIEIVFFVGFALWIW